MLAAALDQLLGKDKKSEENTDPSEDLNSALVHKDGAAKPAAA